MTDASDESKRFALPVRDHPSVHGKRSVSTSTLQYVDPRRPASHRVIPLADGSMAPMGIPIEKLRAKFGGNEGTLPDPLGNMRQISLDPQFPDGAGILVLISYTLQHSEITAS